jgi:hypothetical protein
MAHIAHQPGPVCLEGGVSRWLVGVVGLGAELLQRPHAARGALLQFECLRKTRGVQAFGSCSRRPGRDGRATSSVSGRARAFAGGAKPLLFTTHRQAVSNVQEEENLSCARGQVVIARPPVLTPPWRYRRSLVSKERFAISTNVICVGIRSSLPKRRYRVVMDYVGDLLRHRGKAGCWLFLMSASSIGISGLIKSPYRRARFVLKSQSPIESARPPIPLPLQSPIRPFRSPLLPFHPTPLGPSRSAPLPRARPHARAHTHTQRTYPTDTPSAIPGRPATQALGPQTAKTRKQPKPANSQNPRAWQLPQAGRRGEAPQPRLWSYPPPPSSSSAAIKKEGPY